MQADDGMTLAVTQHKDGSYTVVFRPSGKGHERRGEGKLLADAIADALRGRLPRPQPVSIVNVANTLGHLFGVLERSREAPA